MHVLLVEDEQDVSALITEQLRAMGHTVVAATSGAEALDLFDSLRPRPHLVITDMVLPGGLSGRRLLETLRTYDAGLPGVVISGYSEGVIDREGPLPADVVFLAKPFTRAQLAQALARVQEMKAGQTSGVVTPVTAVPGPVA
jgi:CheY-like chemotaxis protein